VKFNAWDQLRAEHDEKGVGELIEAELRTVLRPIIGHFPNPRLVGRDTDRWDDSLRDEVLYDFALFMLERDRLNAAFYHATDLEHFRMLLRVRARQYVSGKLRGTELRNKVDEACEILESDDRFQRFGSGRARRWTIIGGPSDVFGGDDVALRSLARRVALPRPQRRFRRDTTHASAVITKDDLKEVLIRMLEAAEAALTKSQIEAVLRDRLGLAEPETISISRAQDPAPLEDILAAPSGGLEEADARLAAGDAAQLLSVRQLAIVREYFVLGRKREEVAATLGISHGTISNELRRAGQILLQVAMDDVELARRALEELFQ
jgi:DNA-directed RNA polymerase specialized sigma24 family protein